MEFVEWQFRLQKPLPEGGTLADAFRAFERDLGRKHPDDIAPPPPFEALYLFEWFQDMAAGRPVSMAGWLPLPAGEILAWCSLNRRTLLDWELNAIRRMDAAFLKVSYEKD